MSKIRTTVLVLTFAISTFGALLQVQPAAAVSCTAHAYHPNLYNGWAIVVSGGYECSGTAYNVYTTVNVAYNPSPFAGGQTEFFTSRQYYTYAGGSGFNSDLEPITHCDGWYKTTTHLSWDGGGDTASTNWYRGDACGFVAP